ncbi:MAG: SBBP repeat-containing protein, partial [Candidatus Fermentibacteria bacterium]
TSYDYATVKYNSDGTEQWVARYDGPANFDDSAQSIALDDAGNVYVTGFSNGSTSCDYATIKYNNDGLEQWVARYNSPADERDQARSITLDSAGNVYVTGFDGGINANSNYATVKYNNDGVEQWVSNYNGTDDASDVPSSITVDDAGNVYVTGKSMSNDNGYDYATIKYNNDGAEQWVTRYNGPGNDYDSASSITVASDGNVYVTGFSTGSGTSEDCTTIKYSQDTGITETAVNPVFSLRVYPSPVSNIASIAVTLPEFSECSILVYGLDGRFLETLYEGSIPGGERTFLWQTSQIPAGIYLLRVKAGSMDRVSRVAVIH